MLQQCLVAACQSIEILPQSHETAVHEGSIGAISALGRQRLLWKLCNITPQRSEKESTLEMDESFSIITGIITSPTLSEHVL